MESTGILNGSPSLPLSLRFGGQRKLRRIKGELHPVIGYNNITTIQTATQAYVLFNAIEREKPELLLTWLS